MLMSTGQLSVQCSCSPVYETVYTAEGSLTPVEAIVEALATVEECDPDELDPLYRQFDPDALDRLFASRENADETAMVLGFSVDGWNIFVHGDGRIRVCDPAGAANPESVLGQGAGE